MLKFLVITLFPTLTFAATIKDLNELTPPFSLPALTYSASDMEPIIDKQTMETHHGKHHLGYVDKLNIAVDSSKITGNLIEILKSTTTYPAAVRNNAGGHWNHSFFWTLLTKEPKKQKMNSALEKALNKSFGSIDKFKEQFESSALSVFGSGWVWLIKADDGTLKITTTQNQDNPLMDIAIDSGRPLLSLDVWEHAYYLSYQNKRADYVKNFWQLVNWEQVSKYYKEK